MVTPNFSSAMAGFGLLYSAYFVVLAARGLVRLPPARSSRRRAAAAA